MEKWNSLWACCLLLAVACAADLKETTKVNVTESENSKKLETVSITVQHTDVEQDENGKFKDERSLKVHLRVRVKQGLVMVNEQKAKPNVVFAFHMHSNIEMIAKNARVLKRSMAPVLVRVLVLEEKLTNSRMTASRLHVQAEIVEVEGRKVEQIKVQEIIMEIDNNNNEILAKRSFVMLSLAKAEIHRRPRSKDHHIHCHRKGGHLPDSPYSMGKPRLPNHPYHGDKTLHSMHGKKSFCSSFHNLPFGARLAIFVTVSVVGIAILLCCVHVFCCKRARKSQKYDLAHYDKEYFDVELEDEAPPLEKKKPLDEQKLVINA